MTPAYALHKITCANSFSFDAASYSRFKFGDGAVAESFGHDLATGFIQKYGTALLESKQQLVVLPSPYAAIPTASHAMTMAFNKVLNRFLANNGQAPLETAKIHRFKTYSVDYGALDMNSRLALIINDKYHMDRSFLLNKTLIFIDDIKITGSHELIIRRLLEQFSLPNPAYFLYYAALSTEDIHPNIENTLNYYEVKSIEDLHPIVKQSHFIFNTRIVKYILLAPVADFQHFIAQHNNAFLTQLVDHAISNGYHQMSEYKLNFDYLFNLLHKNELTWQSTSRKAKEPILTSQNSPSV
jgi:hypothetical protein